MVEWHHPDLNCEMLRVSCHIKSKNDHLKKDYIIGPQSKPTPYKKIIAPKLTLVGFSKRLTCFCNMSTICSWFCIFERLKFLKYVIFQSTAENCVLIEFCYGRLSNWSASATDLFVYCTQVVFYKRINRVFFIEAIPKSPSGKILRKDLRAKLAAGFPNWVMPCHFEGRACMFPP